MSSSTQIPRMRLCPCCDGIEAETCSLCKGDRFVTHFQAADWMLHNGINLHDTPVPDTEPEKP